MPALDPRLIADACNCFALKRAARNITRQYDEAFRTLGINNGQFSMLTAIAGLQPVAIYVLGDRLGMDRTTVTAALKPLQRRGLVAVDVADGDLRSRVVTITSDGKTLLRKAIPLWEKAQLQIVDQLGGLSASAEFRKQLGALR